MTDAEQIEALRREVELLRGRIEEIAARANAEPRDEDPDADDFGGGGVPDEGGHVGRPPEGFVENFAAPVPTDTQVAEDPNALQYKSVDEREADQTSEAALQIHDFDEAPLSNTRRVQLRSVTTTGTGGGKKLQLVDPDGNADFQTKWMVPLREAGTGGREIKWACIGGEVDGPEDGCSPTVDLTDLPGTTGHPNGGVRITVTPCDGTATNKDVWNGADGADGCTPTVTAGTTPSEHGDLALTITPCGGATPISVYHGKNGADGAPGATGPQGPQGPAGADGADGCTPTVTAGSTPSEHGDLALTITPCGEGATPISVYHGKNGADGAPGATGPQGPQGPAGADGADGCTPTVTAGSTPSDPGPLALTITPCGEGATPISVYHGKNGDWDGKTDTAVAEESEENTQYRSIEEREEDGALQIRGFDEQSPGGSPLRKIELKLVTTTGTGGGTFLELVDPDGNEVPGTKWTIPLREAGTGGGRGIRWAAFGGKVNFSGGSASVSTDAEQDPGNPPGESVAPYGGAGGPLQIRGFQEDSAKALRYPGEGHTSGITLANAEVIVRDTTGRKRTEYVPASTFWLQGANADQNYAPSIKLGGANGYITISTTS